MKKIWQIAILYLKECARRQLFALPALVCLCLLALPHLITAFSMDGFERVSRDVSLTLMNLLMLGLALVLGGTAIPGEIERRSLYPILSRPLSRYQYVYGKFLGVSLVLLITLATAGACSLAGVSSLTGHFEGGMLLGALFYWLEGCVLAAACLVLSTVASGPLSVAGGILIYVMGGLSNAYVSVFLAQSRRFWMQYWIVWAFKAVVPHFDVFHIKDAIVHMEDIEPAYLGAALLYGLVWVSLELAVAEFAFSRRDV